MGQNQAARPYLTSNSYSRCSYLMLSACMLPSRTDLFRERGQALSLHIRFMTLRSYLSGWVPVNWTVLPLQDIFAQGEFYRWYQRRCIKLHTVCDSNLKIMKKCTDKIELIHNTRIPTFSSFLPPKNPMKDKELIAGGERVHLLQHSCGNCNMCSSHEFFTCFEKRVIFPFEVL